MFKNCGPFLMNRSLTLPVVAPAVEGLLAVAQRQVQPAVHRAHPPAARRLFDRSLMAGFCNH
jgi:hypothetical protein